MLAAVKNDLLCIAKRLENINRRFRVFYNNKTEKFEIHNSSNPDSKSLCFISPFSELDERTLEYAFKTKIENYDELDAEFQENNRKIEQSAEVRFEESARLIDDMMKYADSQIHGVVFHKSGKWF